jgi:prolipoprotein diacylglyceryltransferase
MYPWIHLGHTAISTYSLLFLCAYIAGGSMAYAEARRRGRATEEMLQVALGALAGGMIGAKISMLIFLGPGTWIRDLPHLWYSGQAWTGAFFGGYAGVVLVKRWRGIPYSTGDIFVLGLPLAQAIGRVGNLLGGDPFGLPSALPWAIVQHGVRRQPSALYEAVLDLALLALLFALRDRMPRAGDLFRLYVVGYCSFRFLVDCTRADMRPLCNLTIVQLLYLPTIAWFSYVLWRSYRDRRARRRVTAAAVAAA